MQQTEVIPGTGQPTTEAVTRMREAMVTMEPAIITLVKDVPAGINGVSLWIGAPFRNGNVTIRKVYVSMRTQKSHNVTEIDQFGVEVSGTPDIDDGAAYRIAG